MRFILNIIAVFIATFVGIRFVHLGVYTSLTAVLLFAIVLTIINIVIRPIVKLISLPITCLTFGIFSLVINVLMVMLADKIIDGVYIHGFFKSAVLAIIIAICNTLINVIANED
ncbi:MAG: phage holin family protein [Paraclostridium sp.]|uniref:phage holin family protein n=1 Tax=Paraclostridium sp. TaxID=2023273 RepID=UPI003F3EE805